MNNKKVNSTENNKQTPNNENINIEIKEDKLIEKINKVINKKKSKDIIDDIHQLFEKLSKFEKYSDQSKKYQNQKSENFYDVIIDINSIKHLDIGWKIKMSEEGKNNYNKYKNNACRKIGVIGNENKGKSTILQRISNFNLPTGVSIKTEGLSIKYPEMEDYPNLDVVLLDSAGLETPVLKYEINNDIDNENLNISFAEQSRDKILTEIFLQTFIIKHSDILLLVFGKLSYDEQKLLNKIKNDIENVKRKEPLIIIHNLKEFESLKQIEDYIDNTLKKSLTFIIEEQHLMSKDKTKSDWKYFIELNNKIKIYHLIYAKEGTEAGEFYNKETIEFIISLAQSIPCLNKFDIIDSIKSSFCAISENILENSIKPEDIIHNEDDRIKLKSSETKVILKKCLIDELGISNFLCNGFEPKYDYYIKDDKIFVNIELPGEYDEIEGELEKEGAYQFITISGNKKNNNSNDGATNFFNKRDYGNFSIRIKLEKVNLIDNPEFTLEKGIGCFIYPLEGVKKKRNFLNKKKNIIKSDTKETE